MKSNCISEGSLKIKKTICFGLSILLIFVLYELITFIAASDNPTALTIITLILCALEIVLIALGVHYNKLHIRIAKAKCKCGNRYKKPDNYIILDCKTRSKFESGYSKRVYKVKFVCTCEKCGKTTEYIKEFESLINKSDEKNFDLEKGQAELANRIKRYFNPSAHLASLDDRNAGEVFED